MNGALEGLRVLDITHVLAGPFAAYQLALLGAEVIKLESPHAPDCARGRGPDDEANARGLGLTYQVQGANKRALAVDLQDPRGRDIALDLAATCDVLVENYRTGSLARLGLGYDAVAARAPTLVYCSITGYGDTGPKAGEGAYDNVVQAASGAIAQSGGVKPGLSYVDYTAGYAAAYAISAALLQRARTGRGTRISVSMLEAAMSLMAPEAAALLTGGAARPKEAGIASYQTADGVLMLGAFKPAQYGRLATCLDEAGHPLPELETLNDWPAIWAASERIGTALAAIFAADTTAAWTARLRAHNLPAEAVVSLREAAAAPQLDARGYFATPPGGTAPVPLAPFRMASGGPALTNPPPTIGADTDAILAELGLDAERRALLRREGVIA